VKASGDVEVEEHDLPPEVDEPVKRGKKREVVRPPSGQPPA